MLGSKCPRDFLSGRQLSDYNKNIKYSSSCQLAYCAAFCVDGHASGVSHDGDVASSSSELRARFGFGLLALSHSSAAPLRTLASLLPCR